MNGVGLLKKDGKTVLGEFFADNLVRRLSEEAVRIGNAELADFILRR